MHDSISKFQTQAEKGVKGSKRHFNCSFKSRLLHFSHMKTANLAVYKYDRSC